MPNKAQNLETDVLRKKLTFRVAKQSRSRNLRLITMPGRMFLSLWYMRRAKQIRRGIRIDLPLFWGDCMSGVFPDQVTNFIYRYGYFEEELTRAFIQYVQPGMSVIDIGGHFGYFTLLARYLVGEAGQVHTFEPTPSTMKILGLNTQRYSNIHLVDAAAYYENTSLEFRDYGVAYPAFNTLSQGNLEEFVPSQKIIVQAIRLDDYVAQQKIKPGFIKVDAEGAELYVIEGMKNILQRIKPIVSMEVGDVNIHSLAKSKNIVAMMMDLKYVPWQYQDGGFIRHRMKEKYEYDNLIFIPS